MNGFPAERIPHATESDAYLKKEKQRFIKAIMAGQDAALDSDSDDSLPPSSKTKIPLHKSKLTYFNSCIIEQNLLISKLTLKHF